MPALTLTETLPTFMDRMRGAFNCVPSVALTAKFVTC